jgi:hypothetical protein
MDDTHMSIEMIKKRITDVLERYKERWADAKRFRRKIEDMFIDYSCRYHFDLDSKMLSEKKYDGEIYHYEIATDRASCEKFTILINMRRIFINTGSRFLMLILDINNIEVEERHNDLSHSHVSNVASNSRVESEMA